jgi:large subunit ribosomal protein L6
MSRVGKNPVKIPSGVKVGFEAPMLTISGKLGELTRELPSAISVEVKGTDLFVLYISSDASEKKLHGLWRTLIQNMVSGVMSGYSRELELQGVGYRASAQGSKLNLSVGFSHPVEFLLPVGISAAVESNTKIIIRGADKDLVGLTAARLRKVKPPEPYKGKGIRYLGEVVQLKQGKTAGAAGGAGGGK